MFSTPDHSRKVGLGVIPSPSPSRRLTDSRITNTNSARHDRDREVNVQVLLRCKPLSDDEQRLNVPTVISCNDQRREITVLTSTVNKQVDRAFTFDKVFGPNSPQQSIYDQAISPIVNEVLEGFNCTVFAYGQTGTGKTYTMEGGMKSKDGALLADAGVIPRAVRQIFDTLEAEKADYCMKVTFLELYNEEITDLLALEDHGRSVDDKQKKPISLMEDGKGGVSVRGLEEVAVHSANDIYKLLEQGSAKRRTVDTLLNKHSSRSHSVFSISIHVKEATVGDTELLKSGKLNLVDLAGSENISRSGAREARAREAGEINKSLLTLGRVINALAEHSVHIPYRDSKLTRLLRDSLGGKTKTCIIATVSPSAHCLEETLSTLDYAYRAKNIRNKPEANQKMSKAVLLKDLYLELEKMKEDVRAAREKNGVYLTHERFAQDEADKKAMCAKITQMETDLDLRVKQADTFQKLYFTEQEKKLDLESELKECKINLENCNKAWQDLQEKHNIATSALEEKDFIISRLQNSETSIIEQSKLLHANLENASMDITALFAKLDRKNEMEAENQGLVLRFGSQLDQSLKSLHETVLGAILQQQQQLRCMERHVSSFIASKCDQTKALKSKIKKIKNMYSSGVGAINEFAQTLEMKSSSNLTQIKSTVSSRKMDVEKFLAAATSEADEVICSILCSLEEQKQLLAFSAQQQKEGLQRGLVSLQMITRTTNDFLNDLQHRAYNIMNIVEESEAERSHQIATCQMKFQEKFAREEKQALEKISDILANLSSNKTAIVSETFQNIDATSTEEKKMLQKEMVGMQQASEEAKKGWNGYVEKVESHFFEETVSAAETRTIMEAVFQECSNRVDYSRQQWEMCQQSVARLNKSNISEIESLLEEKVHAHQTSLEEFFSAVSAGNAKFDARSCDLLNYVQDSLQLDVEAKKELLSISTSCLDQLTSMQEDHNQRIHAIRSQADQSLKKDYAVDDRPTSTTPKKRAVVVPTLASIEQMKTPAIEHLVANMRTVKKRKGADKEEKCTESPDRTPFGDIN